MQDEIRPDVAAFTAQHARPPGLGIVLVGDDPASEVYVRGKVKAGTAIGFRVDLERLPATATLADTLALVGRLNGSDVHDGVLVQSPLPKAMGPHAEQQVFDAVAPGKDVDGLTPVNVGLLVQKRATRARRPASSSCSSASTFRSRDAAPSSSAAATLSASRWRSSCCIATRP